MTPQRPLFPTHALAATAVAFVLALATSAPAVQAQGKATQVAAKVNKEEISVHQINFMLQRTPGVTQETSDAASRQILDRLITQELAVQQAQELKLDRNPAVVQAMEAARREVLARAFIDRLGEGVAKPSAQEVSEFYNKRTALFKERKVYSLLEVNVVGNEEQIGTVRQRLQAAKTPKDFTDWIKGSGLKHQAGQANQPAENLPLDQLDRMAAIPDGQGIVIPQAGGAKVVVVLASQKAPVDEATARPAIEQFILNDRKRVKVEADMKALRANAKVELVGKFAEAAPAAGAPATAPAKAPATAGAPGTPGAVSTENVTRGLGLR